MEHADWGQVLRFLRRDADQTHAEELGPIGELALTAYLAIIVVILVLAGMIPPRSDRPDLLPKRSLLVAEQNAAVARLGTLTTGSRVSTPQEVRDAKAEDRPALVEQDVSELAGLPANESEQTADQDAVDASSPLLALDFSLPTRSGGSVPVETERNGNIRVNKPVQVGSASAGSIAVTIDPDSRLLVQSEELRSLLQKQANTEAAIAKLPQSGLVSFNSLRDLGVNLRYNPVEDRIVIAQN